MADEGTELDPSTMTGFSEHLFTVLDRFRTTAIDDHMATGESLEDITYHEHGFVTGDALLNTYQPPVAMSMVTGYQSRDDTTRTRREALNVTVAIFDWNFDRAWAMEHTLKLAAEVVDNVERNRTLESSGGGDPVAWDIDFDDLQPDFRFAPQGDAAIFWASVEFDVKTRRARPTS